MTVLYKVRVRESCRRNFITLLTTLVKLLIIVIILNGTGKRLDRGKVTPSLSLTTKNGRGYPIHKYHGMLMYTNMIQMAEIARL